MAETSLRREVGLGGAIALGLGSIFGTGVFVSIGLAAGITGPWVMAAVFVAGLLATANALASAQLAAKFPVSGGAYEYAYRLVSPTAGYSAGVLFLLAKCASAAAASLALAHYLTAFVPMPAMLQSTAGALIVLGSIAGLAAGGIRRSNATNAVIVGTVLVALTVFLAAVAPQVLSSSLWSHPWPSVSAKNLAEATALMFVAYTGYGRLATLGEEVKDPAKIIPRAILGSLAVAITFYLLIALSGVSILGGETYAETARTGAPLREVAIAAGVGWVGPALVVAAGLSLAGVILNLILGISRVVLAMARRRDLPGWFAKIDEHSSSPTRAVIATACAIAMLILGLTLVEAWSFSAFCVLVYYGINNWAALRLDDTARRFPLWITYAALATCAVLALSNSVRAIALGLGFLAVALVIRRILHSRK